MSARLALNTILVLAIVACLVGAVVLIVRDSRAPDGVVVSIPTRLPQTPTPLPQSELIVHVSGAVRLPGVYTLGPDDRAADALSAAGGPTDDADLDRVNLAKKLRDEEQLHIPLKRDAGIDGRPETQSNVPVTFDVLDLNSATIEELQSLPGIGITKAAAIVDYRETNGLFRVIDDLVQVNGIGEGILGSIRHLVEVR